ncbi:hypothetical protein [Roseovarius nanhaiticus]|uniref:hypothetical protein n=1 Tax=Roseovarius nanhaiticus TaxID=573024 RepID=UPI00111377D5|nr:hypothetical protein [Roseovarius nanhaiticus]
MSTLVPTPRQSAFVNAALFLPRDIEGQGQAELVVREAVHGALFQQHPQVHYRIASRLASETGPPEARGPACR